MFGAFSRLGIDFINMEGLESSRPSSSNELSISQIGLHHSFFGEINYDLTFFLCLSNSFLKVNKEIFIAIYDKWKIQTYQVYQSSVRVVSEPQKSVEDGALSAVAGAMICLGVLIGISSVILLFTLIR